MFVLLFVAGTFPLVAQQDSKPAAPEPAKPQTEQPKPIAVPDIAERSTSLAATLRETAIHAEPDSSVEEIRANLRPFSVGVQDLANYSKESLKSTLSIRRTADLRAAWQAVSERAEGWARLLQKRAANLEADRAKLLKAEKEWDLTLQSDELQDLPQDVKNRVVSALEAIRTAQKQVNERRSTVVLLQGDVAEQQVLIESALDQIRTVENQQRVGLFGFDNAPLWQTLAAPSSQDLPNTETNYEAQAAEWMRSVAAISANRLGLFLALATFVWFVLRLLRKQSSDWELSSAENARAITAVIRRPFSSAVFMAVILSAMIVQEAPIWMIRLAAIVLLIPSLRLLPQMIREDLRRPFYILVILIVLFQVLSLASESFAWDRPGWVMFQAVSVVYLLLLFRTLRRSPALDLFAKSIRSIVMVCLIALAIALVANVAGMVRFSQLLTRCALISLFAAVLLKGMVVTASAFLSVFLQSRKLEFIVSTKHSRELMERRLTRILNVSGICVFGLTFLYLTTLLGPFAAGADAFLSSELKFGAIHITLYSILTFLLVILGTLLISGVLRFTLEVTAYPRLRLQVGQAQAFSKILHYAVLSVGLATAAAAAGLGLSNLAILAGGLSVGIGFGLQNIVNNFVSGLILLFERPIQVGDSVTVGTTAGIVSDIGIRASVIRAWDGAEVIVPNGNLISGELTNWTHSDTDRRVDVNVGTSYSSDPRKVIEILTKIAKEHGNVLPYPEPVALFTGFGDSSLNFILRFFCSSDNWVSVSSDIHTRIFNAFKEAGIEIPFPQRDLNIRALPVSLLELKQVRSELQRVDTAAAGQG